MSAMGQGGGRPEYDTKCRELHWAYVRSVCACMTHGWWRTVCESYIDCNAHNRKTLEASVHVYSTLCRSVSGRRVPQFTPHGLCCEQHLGGSGK